MRVFVDNWSWQGVPFFLTSGKRLAEKLSEISIRFREVPQSIFHNLFGEEIRENSLTPGIYPEENISLTFQTKNPGAMLRLRPLTIDFRYRQSYSGPLPDAYEKVLIDTIRGDQMLFLRQDAVELIWSIFAHPGKMRIERQPATKIVSLPGGRLGTAGGARTAKTMS